jgi:ABC-2 type transport system ATP-binding protein
MEQPMIEVENLSRRFGPVRAVTELTFRVERGEILGFIGPNGAGKTTTMRMLTGYLPPSRGRAEVGGIDVQDDPRAVRRQLGYLAERNPLHDEMRVGSYLAYRARLKSVPRRRVRAAVARVVEHCGIGDMQDRIIGTLSRGYRQRVGLADSLVHDPRILILDEPTVGLDPNQVQGIRDYLRSWAGEDRTIILSTHILSEVEALCSRAIVIAHGARVADAPVPELVSQDPGGLESTFRALTTAEAGA